MNLGVTLALAFSLSMDAFAVSLGYALASIRLRSSDMLKLAASFGLFQAGMPLAGWLLADRFVNIIKAWDHWVAFFLLFAIGLHMIYSGFHGDGTLPQKTDRLSTTTVLVLSIGTSIDAFAAGISFIGIEDIPIGNTVAVIGVVTFIFSTVAMIFGKRLGKSLSSKATLLGGVVLIGVGVKILLEHILK